MKAIDIQCIFDAVYKDKDLRSVGLKPDLIGDRISGHAILAAVRSWQFEAFRFTLLIRRISLHTWPPNIIKDGVHSLHSAN